MIPKDIVIHELTTEQLWKYYKIAYMMNYVDEGNFNNVKNGFKIQFDIRDYIRAINGQESCIIFNYINKIIYLKPYANHKVSQDEFENEIDTRTTLMMKELIEYQNDDIIEER